MNKTQEHELNNLFILAFKIKKSISEKTVAYILNRIRYGIFIDDINNTVEEFNNYIKEIEGVEKE